jgi:hypothetical protein
MSPHQAISHDFKPVEKPTTQADFSYSIMPNTIAIVDTGNGRRSVTNDIEAVLRKIEYWHQGSVTGFKIAYRDENGVWDGIRWDGQHPAFFALQFAGIKGFEQIFQEQTTKQPGEHAHG